MGQFDSIYKASIGGVDFQLETLNESNEPEVDDGGLETARNVSIVITGWVEGTDGSGLATKIASARAGFTTRGVDFVVTGLGGAKYCELLAATCVNGGPHVAFEFLESDAPLVRKIRATITAQQRPVSGPIPSPFPVKEDTRKLTIETTPDLLQTLTFEGTVSGPGATAFFLDHVLQPLSEIYPLQPEPGGVGWVISHKYDVNITDDKLTYSVHIKEMATPFGVPQGIATIVDGELIRDARDRDGERLTLTTSCDFLVLGDMEEVVKMIRPAGVGVFIIRESVEKTVHQERRLRARFTVLQSADQNGLLEWESSVELQHEDPVARAVPYDGVRVELVYDLAAPRHLIITGRAVGLGRYVKEPSVPVIKGYQLAEPPTVRLSKRLRYECETTWSYSLVGTAGLGNNEARALTDALARPSKPVFYK
jgi:hypothetical protein